MFKSINPQGNTSQHEMLPDTSSMAVNQNTKIVSVGENMRNVNSGILLTGM